MDNRNNFERELYLQLLRDYNSFVPRFLRKEIADAVPLGHPHRRRDGTSRPPIERAAQYVGWAACLSVPGFIPAASSTSYVLRKGKLALERVPKGRVSRESNLNVQDIEKL